MSLPLRLSITAFASITGLIAIIILLWPGWIASLMEGGPWLPWQTGPWSLALDGPRGRQPGVGIQPALLFMVMMLTGITVFTTGFPPQAVAPESSAQQGANRTNDAAEALALESGKLISLVTAHQDASGTYREALTRINADLPDAGRPEQLRLLISYLMVENDSMRARTQALQMNLQKAKTQIESLNSRLEVAHREGHSCGLTGLHNRRGFDSMLAREMAQAQASGSPLCLVMADIDHFKSVNDRFGHLTGDDVLKWIARILKASMKGRDTIARYGGEEFALILPHTELHNAEILAGQIREQIEQTKWRLPGSQSNIKITASFGIAAWQAGEDAVSLIRRADEMLYAAKATGRNKVMS